MSHARQWDRSFMLSHSTLSNSTMLPFHFTDANTMQELGSNSKCDFKTYAKWWHATYTMHTTHRNSIPSTWEYETYYTYNSSARKEIFHFYKETEAQTREADMEKFILTWEDRQSNGRNTSLGLHNLSLHPFSSRFLYCHWLQDSVLIPFCAPLVWATSSISTTSTFWWTPNLIPAQIFLLSTRPLLGLSMLRYFQNINNTLENQSIICPSRPVSFPTFPLPINALLSTHPFT